MLVFDPRKRIDAATSLAHEYVAPYHDPTDEPVAAEQFDWSFNDADLPIDTWKVMMYSEILGQPLSAVSYLSLYPSCYQISTRSASQQTLLELSQKARLQDPKRLTPPLLRPSKFWPPS